ncbi:toll/interleukin-1 receptor domain-containing protein [Pseudomonas sp. HMWF031]|nr:toll/interleukin-1 receptor domain-containing protein [Pseudomonas sp. HMWF031]
MSTVKIFISHQQQDANPALLVKTHLKQRHNIECYLDVIDPFLKRGEEIADHVRRELAKCSHLLAIVSDATKGSWWVPWEIGVATEKDYPLATYGTNVTLPEYLMKWPYLKSYGDLDKYAEAILETARAVPSLEHRVLDSATASTRGSGTKQFYRTLRSKLGQ